MRPNNFKKCMKPNWNFQRGGEVLEKIPFMGEVWIFFGTTQYKKNFTVLFLNYKPLKL